ncbi:MAG TPA: ABC transporter permease subunit [Candidatus Kapabacteria bacterium]|nr:ABC transporter permease subunit [Candidatus Kapabacteria bacterium]
MKFLAIIEATIREGIARKTILGMFIVSTVTIVVAILLFQMNVVQQGLLSPVSSHAHVRVDQNGTTSNAGNLALAGMTVLDMVWMGISSTLLVICVFLGVFVTAGFITSIMEKGSIDLLLSKPVSRWVYIAGRYTGAVLIIFAEVAYLIIGLWLVAGFSLGSWSPAFLGSILIITLAFAGVYSLVTLFGVLTRSSWFAIIIGLALYIIGSIVIPLGQFLDKLLNGEPSGGALVTVSTGLRYLVPSQEMGRTIASVILTKPLNYGPLFVTLGLCVGYVALSCLAFSKKEF